MAFNKGSLILVDYTSKVKDTGEVFETTIEEEAKKHSLHEPNVKYQPKLVSVGESWVVKGLDEALAKTINASVTRYAKRAKGESYEEHFNKNFWYTFM